MPFDDVAFLSERLRVVAAAQHGVEANGSEVLTTEGDGFLAREGLDVLAAYRSIADHNRRLLIKAFIEDIAQFATKEALVT